MYARRYSLAFVSGVLILGSLSVMSAQTDPGVRPGVPGAGGPLAGLSTQERQRFSAGLEAFQEVLSVTGSKPGTEAGLGPRFNLDSCFGCHKQPALGGSSPASTRRLQWQMMPVATTTRFLHFIDEQRTRSGGEIQICRWQIAEYS